jgi:hypothetical protein
MKSIPFISFMILGSFIIVNSGIAQPPDGRIWNVSQFVDLKSNDRVTYSCSFETHANKIKWIQKAGARITEFEISGKTNTWTDIQVTGEVIYKITSDGNVGSLRFYRTGGQLFVETILLVNGKNTLPFKFTVNSTSAL